MRRDHAPIVAVELRVIIDPRTEVLKSRYEKALRDQYDRNLERAWRVLMAARRAPRLPTNVITFGTKAGTTWAS